MRWLSPSSRIKLFESRKKEERTTDILYVVFSPLFSYRLVGRRFVVVILHSLGRRFELYDYVVATIPLAIYDWKLYHVVLDVLEDDVPDLRATHGRAGITVHVRCADACLRI